MSLPTGLLPVLVFVSTVGVSTFVTVGAFGLAHRGDPFESALRRTLGVVAVAWVVGTGGVWWVAGLEVWGVAATLLGVGVATLVAFVALPLLVGRRLLSRFAGVDDVETALRRATLGWPVAMLAVFGVFVAPGGPGGGTLLSLGGPRVCIAGFCGVSVPVVAAATLAVLVAVVGPGVVGALAFGRVIETA